MGGNVNSEESRGGGAKTAREKDIGISRETGAEGSGLGEREAPIDQEEYRGE